MTEIYVITGIEREGGNTAEDNKRIGKRVHIGQLTLGSRAVLPWADDNGMAVITTPVEAMIKSNRGIIYFVTRNTEYHLTEASRYETV